MYKLDVFYCKEKFKLSNKPLAFLNDWFGVVASQYSHSVHSTCVHDDIFSGQRSGHLSVEINRSSNKITVQQE